MLRLLTAGESHGKMEIAVLEGFPAGIKLDKDIINSQLKRRQKGYGRGKRMKIESDEVEISSGLRKSFTIGSPITFLIKNKDYSIDSLPDVKSLRPGHADYAGAVKYGFKDARSVLERASARETAARVAAGSACKIFLSKFNINILSHTLAVGNIKSDKEQVTINEIKKSENSLLSCVDAEKEEEMIRAIDEAAENKDTLGGVTEVVIEGIPPGIGSYVHFDRRLDGKLAKAVMSIPSVKAVEIGRGINCSYMFGSLVHDQIYSDEKKSVTRKTNNAGGLEGGVSNGETIFIRAYMKPISTLMNPLNTVDIDTVSGSKAATERSDVCAVPAGGVVAESMCAFEIMDSFLSKFGQDSFDDIKKSFNMYLNKISKFYKRL